MSRGCHYRDIADLEAHLGQRAAKQAALRLEAGLPHSEPPKGEIALPRASNKPRRGEMNQTESRYYSRLAAFMLAGVIDSIEFEPLAFDLGWRCAYTPDFRITRTCDDETMTEYHEVKGPHCWEDSRVKFKVAARLYGAWDRFVWAQWTGDGWRFEVFEAGVPVKLDDEVYR